MSELPQDLDLQLLLYASDELAQPQRAAVERLLAGDPEARRRLEAVRAAMAASSAHLSALDAAEPIDLRVRGIERALPRMLRQWQVDRAVREAAVRTAGDGTGGSRAAARIRRVPMWLYPLATAAAVLLVLGVWSLVLSDEPDGGGDAVAISNPAPGGPAGDRVAQGDNDDDTPAVPDRMDAVRRAAVADANVVGGNAAANRSYEELLAALQGGDDGDTTPAGLAATWWNPMRDVGGDALASLERDYARLQVLDYSFR